MTDLKQKFSLLVFVVVFQEQALRMLAERFVEELDTEVFDRVSNWIQRTSPGLFDEVRV